MADVAERVVDEKVVGHESSAWAELDAVGFANDAEVRLNFRLAAAHLREQTFITPKNGIKFVKMAAMALGILKATFHCLPQHGFSLILPSQSVATVAVAYEDAGLI